MSKPYLKRSASFTHNLKDPFHRISVRTRTSLNEYPERLGQSGLMKRMSSAGSYCQVLSQNSKCGIVVAFRAG